MAQKRSRDVLHRSQKGIGDECCTASKRMKNDDLRTDTSASKLASGACGNPSLEDLSVAIASETGLNTSQVLQTLRLLDGGDTIPFISRYRKHVTEGLSEVEIRTISRASAKLLALAAHKSAVLLKLELEGHATPSTAKAVQDAESVAAVNDVYAPYKSTKLTRAAAARAQNLQPLADALLRADKGDGARKLAKRFLRDAGTAGADRTGRESVDGALRGALDIIAEDTSRVAELREAARAEVLRCGALTAKLSQAAKKVSEVKKMAKKAAKGSAGVPLQAKKGGRVSGHLNKDAKATLTRDQICTYQQYEDFVCPVSRLMHHQVLAVARGAKQSVLTAAVRSAPHTADALRKRAISHFADMFFPSKQRVPGGACKSHFLSEVENAMADGVTRLLLPAAERAVMRQVTEAALDAAAGCFARNVRSLLLSPPLPRTTVMGLDPGFTHGCKMAVCDAGGAVLATETLFPLGGSDKQRARASEQLLHYLTAHSVAAIAIGNGVGCRPTEAWVAGLITADSHLRGAVRWCVQSESGASIYSTSELAARELPELDCTLRGAVTIARRLQDPLAELVKVEPRHLGVGMYQHDVPKAQLQEELSAAVESAVNGVGADLNSASSALLIRVAGLTKPLVERIVDARLQHGPFSSRADLKRIKGIGQKRWQQCAGFLLVQGSANALDGTRLHPENYAAAATLVRHVVRANGARESLGLAGTSANVASEKQGKHAGAGSGGVRRRGTGKPDPGQSASAGAPEDRETITCDELAAAMPELCRLRDAVGGGDEAELRRVGCILGMEGPALVQVHDIVSDLCNQGAGVRGELAPHYLRDQPVRLETLQRGDVLRGTVRNVVDFGAFVDVGMEEDGLVHVTQLRNFAVRQLCNSGGTPRRDSSRAGTVEEGSSGRVQGNRACVPAGLSASDVVGVGMLVTVVVDSVDVKRRRIGLWLQQVGDA